MVKNRLFHRFATLMQVVSAGILDFAFFYVSLYWVLYERNFRLFAALIIFYGIRAIHLNIFKLEFANKYYWDDPGFPAFVVKYGKYSDFFYSVKVKTISIGSCWFSCNLFFRNEKTRKKMVGFIFFHMFIFLSIHSYFIQDSLYNRCNFI